MRDTGITPDQIWDAFLERWPLEALVSINLEQYTQADSKDSFSYWVEFQTMLLGSIRGGGAFKFGIYHRKNPPKEKRRYFSHDDAYSWYAKYGETREAAFEKIRALVAACAHAARQGDLATVEALDLGDVYKWKLAFLYQDRNAPIILPLYKVEYLYAALGQENAKLGYAALYQRLLAARNGEPLFEYADKVFARGVEVLGHALTAEQALEYFLSAPERFQAIKEPTQYIAGFNTSSGRQIALVRDNKDTTLFLTPGPWQETVRKKLGRQQEYPPEKTRSSNLEANAPELALGKPAVAVKVPTKAALIALSDAYDEPDVPEQESTMALTSVPTTSPLNQIFFGPPGTGKTYKTVDAALEILDPTYLAIHRQDRKALKARFDELADAGHIRFVTFHQSFSYEDFVEGLRANTDADGTLRYEVEAGVFKALCEAASVGIPHAEHTLAGPLANLSNANGHAVFQQGDRFGNGYIVQRATPDVLDLVKPNGCLLPFGMSMLNLLADYVRQGWITIADIREKRVFDKVPDSKLERYLVNGYNNVLPALIEALCGRVVAPERQPAVAEASIAAMAPSNKVLIIDEINRGNVSRIFGELITLIEPSKRSGADEALQVVLPYSKARFSVPNNVYLIGTMNTADRSLASIDIALRRRFVFKEMAPQPNRLTKMDVAGVNIGEMLKAINQRIEVLLDRDHCIGHSYFMDLQSGDDLGHLADIFSLQVIPLLQEYFFEDWERIRWVLNDHRKAADFQFVVSTSTSVAALFGDDLPGMNNARPRWNINAEAFEKPESYSGIIKV
jgi:5-methylcytosine-specific restriction enzyme B